MRQLILRLVSSAVLIILLLAVCEHIKHVDHATVALVLVLSIVGVATAWGWAEALTAAVAAGIGFDYFFLPPRGFGIAAPEHWIAFIAFLITAAATGQLAIQTKKRRLEAEQRNREMEKLFQLANAMLRHGGADFSLTQLTDQLAEILGADGVALYDLHTRQVVRSGARGPEIDDHALHEVAQAGKVVQGKSSGFFLTPIRHGGEVVGSMGVSGANAGHGLIPAIATQVGLGLARLYAIERTTEAEASRRSEELKSATLDAIAHEIRNPLNSVKIAATTLLSAPPRSEMHKREMLIIIGEEVDRMDHLLDEAVQMARLDANGLSLNKAPEDLLRLIPAAVEEMRSLAERRRIEVTVPDSLPLAECDAAMITRVIKQLVSNALKYSPHDSPLAISADFNGSAIVVDVVDHGPGVAEEERERIFEKYYRGRAARVGTRGTGLGLASAKSIMEAHGGNIWVTRPDGGGAAFHFSIPVPAASAPVGAS